MSRRAWTRCRSAQLVDNTTAASSLSQLVEQEQHWLSKEQIQTEPFELDTNGWTIDIQQWQELLTLLWGPIPGGRMAG